MKFDVAICTPPERTFSSGIEGQGTEIYGVSRLTPIRREGGQRRDSGGVEDGTGREGCVGVGVTADHGVSLFNFPEFAPLLESIRTQVAVTDHCVPWCWDRTLTWSP